MTGLADHLWQSSLFALVVALFTLAFVNHAARIRFWLWFAASLKFLLPFAALTALGAGLGEKLAHLLPQDLPPAILKLAPAAEKWSAPAQTLAPSAGDGRLVQVLVFIWALGFAAVALSRLSRWLTLKALLNDARPLAVDAPVEVRSSASLLEPGLVGIFRPVVLLPQGLLASLSRAERDGILAHELTHLARRDNLTAALHMLVEALFWFWPPVWLIGARLIAERERACDESVVAAGHDPEAYAGGILKVCRFCIRSPLACAPGASGADLSHRVRLIMTGPQTSALDGGRRLLLAGAALLSLTLPLLAGLAAGVQSQFAAMAPQVAAGFTRMVAVAQDIATAPMGALPSAPVKVKRLPRLAGAPVPMIQPVPAGPPLPAAAPLPLPPAPVQVAVAPPPPTPAPAAKDVLLASNPDGEGDPDQVTCRVPQRLPNSRLPGPRVCQSNSAWAALAARGAVLAPDGKTVLLAGRRNDVPPFSCPTGRMTGSATNSATGLVAGICL